MFVVLTPCLLFLKVIRSLVRNEKDQDKGEGLKKEIRRRNLNNKNRRK